MSNVTVQEALKKLHDGLKKVNREHDVEHLILQFTEIKAALAEIEKCEPVAEAIRERDRLGFAVVNVIGKLDEIIENTQEVEIDDFLHIAVPIDMWNELQAALEDMPKRADFYTSPQHRDWVGLTDKRIEEIAKLNGAWQLYSSLKIFDFVAKINDELKQLNTKG